jgi:hypothetical protein
VARLGAARQGLPPTGVPGFDSPAAGSAVTSAAGVRIPDETRPVGFAPRSAEKSHEGNAVNIEFILKGNSALLCHNPQMVDPECEWNKLIREITRKRIKTDDDLKEIKRLEWYGGVYTGEVNGKSAVVQPSSKVRKCLINAGRITKQGKQIERAIVMTELNVSLIYDGCDKVKDFAAELERLQTSAAFNSRLSVGVGGKRIMRVRPQFAPWALIVPAVFIPDAGLNFEELERIVELAGQAERIGDNRANGYGSFRGAVREVAAKTAPVKPTIDGVRQFFDGLDAAEAA